MAFLLSQNYIILRYLFFNGDCWHAHSSVVTGLLLDSLHHLTKLTVNDLLLQSHHVQVPARCRVPHLVISPVVPLT